MKNLFTFFQFSTAFLTATLIFSPVISVILTGSFVGILFFYFHLILTLIFWILTFCTMDVMVGNVE